MFLLLSLTEPGTSRSSVLLLGAGSAAAEERAANAVFICKVQLAREKNEMA